jgi:glyoxylase-like metal-dependent hydrolase (beta-lactamase superfamily II)
MIVVNTMDSNWLSNTCLVADKPGGHAVLIDTGGPVAPILEKVEELRLTVSHVLCTHLHVDQIAHNAEVDRDFHRRNPTSGPARDRREPPTR